ncbi:MAG: hypothetical protein CO189_05680 [candidate division Zixibacteria bacterium CG_4_9_14_3_um_filter_46_8]|nr:MAG: hypothetical protein CO189_05680 [candidate division Zixibacteria bacterium CG_4_9_14_3_um_filter_46_8]
MPANLYDAHRQWAVRPLSGLDYICQDGGDSSEDVSTMEVEVGTERPKTVKYLEKDFDKLIPFLEFPQECHKVIRTTNVIERCFREVRRRLNAMGYFPNSKSCKRNEARIFEYFNIKWQRKSEKIKPIADHYSKVA